MKQKTVLLIDDEQGLLEPLEDALLHEGCRVLKAFTGEQAITVLQTERVDLVTVDVMMPPGKSLEAQTSGHRTGVYLCRRIRKEWPGIHVFCLSVLNDDEVIREIKKLGVRFLRKGETPLVTVLNMIRSCLTGVAYDSHRDAGGRR